jgi:hypothetical protein
MANALVASNPILRIIKSAAFNVVSSHLRDAQALTCLFMLLATANLIAVILGVMLVRLGQMASIDWHDHRGLSFLQLGLRQLLTLLYQQKSLPLLLVLPLSHLETPSEFSAPLR